jgi:hypothetical protein
MKMSTVNQNKNHIKNVLGVEELVTLQIIVMLIPTLKDMIYIINKFDFINIFFIKINNGILQSC